MPAKKKAHTDEFSPFIGYGYTPLDRFSKKDGSYAGRFPTSFVVRDAIEGNHGGAKNPNPSPGFGNSQTGALRDPYNQASKNRFEDTFRADSTANRAVVKLVESTLGKIHEVVLDSRKQYATNELRKQAMKNVLGNADAEKLLSEIKEIDVRVKLHERLMSAQTQKYVYGRSALAIVFKDGRPVELKQLSSKNLGQVYIDKDWKLTGVQYTDPLIKANIIPADEMLYFTNLDYNVTPDTLFYGQSKLEGVAHASEAKRIILEEDVKETAKGGWAPYVIISAPDLVNSSKGNTFLNGLDPGKTNLVNIPVEPHVIQQGGDALKLLQVVHELDRYIIRGIGVPNMLVGFEDVQNYATAKEVMAVFNETVVEFERSVLQSQLDSQWYDTLTQLITGMDPLELEYKVRLEFQSIVLDSFKDKVDAIAALESAGIPLPLEEKLERLNLGHLADQIAELEEEKREEEQELMKERQEQMEKGQMPTGNSVPMNKEMTPKGAPEENGSSPKQNNN